VSALQNLVYTIEGDELVMRVNLARELRPSSTGKSMLTAVVKNLILGSSGYLLSLTVFRPLSVVERRLLAAGVTLPRPVEPVAVAQSDEPLSSSLEV